MEMITYLLLLLPLASPYRYMPEEVIRPYDRNAPANFQAIQSTALDLPYHALVVYGGYYCSGSLVSSRIIVTAASCFHKNHSDTKPFVKIGSDTIIESGEFINVSDVKIHEFFQRTSLMDNDIALLVLTKHVKFGPQVEKIALIEPNTALRVGTSITVSGWGSLVIYGKNHNHIGLHERGLKGGAVTSIMWNLKPKDMNKLLLTQMTVMDRASCEKVHGVLITKSNFCATYDPEGRLSDNGGPATHSELLIGILSFGALRKPKPNVAVFTNVSYFHKWIVKNTKRYMKKYCSMPVYSDYTDDDENEPNESYYDDATNLRQALL